MDNIEKLDNLFEIISALIDDIVFPKVDYADYMEIMDVLFEIEETVDDLLNAGEYTN